MTSAATTVNWDAPSPEKTVSTARPSGRVQWLDIAKGLGILFVVAGHALGGMIDSPASVKLPFLRLAFIAIYIFHMPCFFFLSGLLVQPRIAKGGTAFFLGALATIVYPYFLWSTIQYSAIYAAGSLVNRPVAVFWGPILNLPFSSISQFWYLYVLFLMHMAALLVIPRMGAKSFFGLAVAAKLIVPLLTLPVMIRLSLLHGAFYAAGVLGGMGGLERAREWLRRNGAARTAILLLGPLAVLIGTWALTAQLGDTLYGLRSFETSVLAWRLPLLPAALAGSAAIIVAAMFQRGRGADILAYLGQRSMAIFVLHVLFIAGSRILLTRFLHLPPVAVLLLCMTIGLLLPLAVDRVAKSITRSRLLGLG